MNVQKLMFATAWFVAMTTSALAGEWSPTPRQLPGRLDVRLTESEDEALSSVMLFPPKETAESLSFSEALVLQPLTLEDVLLSSAGSVHLDAEKFHRVTRAFQRIKILRAAPSVKAYEDQAKVVRYYEALLECASPSEAPGVGAELEEARRLLARYEATVTAQAPDEIQAAILRSAHRDLSLGGIELPPILTFLKEWPVWIVKIANTDFLTIRLRLATGVSDGTKGTLEALSTKFPNFKFRYGTVSDVVVTNNTTLRDFELMSRATIERTGPDDFDLTFRLTFAGALAYFDSQVRQTYVPYDLGVVAEASSRTLKVDAMQSGLCIATQLMTDGQYVAKKCGE